jgi:hypothetical protein
VRSSNAPYLIADFVNAITNSLVKFFYFSLALFLNSDGFMALEFFQTPTRDHCVVDFYAITPHSLQPNVQLN